MKRLLPIGIFLLLLTVLLLFTACGDTPADTTSADTTTEAAETGKLVETERYTATLNEASFDESQTVSKEVFFAGTGKDAVNRIGQEYISYAKTYYLIEGTSRKKLTHTEARALETVGVALGKKDENAKTVELLFYEIDLQVQSSWQRVTAKAGSYLMFDVYANCPLEMTVTVTAKEGAAAASAVFVQEEIAFTRSGNRYIGKARCTVPFTEGKTVYLNLCADSAGKNILYTVPLTVTAPYYESPYQVVLKGDFDLLKEGFADNLLDLFYTFYPRIYQRFGSGVEPKLVTIHADKDYEGVAYFSTDRVVFSTSFANGNGDNIAYFTHELTHSVQHFARMHYGDGNYFTEAIADYGCFRYWHWVDDESRAKIYSMNDPDIRDFGWEPYGQHNVFMAYLDWKYPTTKNPDGSLKYGLIDTLVFNTKTSKVDIDDDPYDEDSVFNGWVKEITGLATFEEVRLQFVKELDEGTFVFTGFDEYVDNFLAEGIDNVADPTYTSIKKVTPAGESHTPLAAPITTGTNLLKGATIQSVTTKGEAKFPVSALVDGDLSTRYQAAVDETGRTMRGVENEVVLDLGEVKTFDTYTIVNAGHSMTKSFNTKFWEILVSDDGKTFVSVDYQSENKESVVSVNIGETSARYIKLRLYQSDSSGAGTARIFELMLFSTES